MRCVLVATLTIIIVLVSNSWTNADLLSDVGKIIGAGEQTKPVVCMLCNIGISAFLGVYRNPFTNDKDVRDLAIGLCLQLRTHSDVLCSGLVDANMETLEYILDNRDSLTADRICGMIFQGDNCGTSDPSLDWSVSLGEHSPVTLETTKSSTAAPITIIQLTDVHYDPKYVTGGNALCNEPVCCRSDQGVPKNEAAKAGRWGNYRSCDMPWEVVANALSHIKQQHKDIDYIYMTGDLVDHGIWDTSISGNNETFKKVIAEIKNTFPDIPVFPCLGNHEAHPVNVFAPTSIMSPNISSHWLYEVTADLWSAWLPAYTKETILKGGYYTALVRPGFRVIALNSNQCHTYNWWILYDGKDPDGQLEWLIQVLKQAEIDKEKVHILNHISPGHTDCYKIWSREFNRIISRFANTVTAQFSGHTHFDEFQIFYSVDNPKEAVNVLYNGGSLTTYQNVNPNYKVYTIDADNFNVIDHATWIYNVTAANLSPDKTPDWFKMYSFLEAYKVESLAPQELDKLVHRIASNEGLLKQHFEFHNLLGDPKLEKGCNQECREKLLCQMVMTNSGDRTQCDQLIAEYRILKRIKSEPHM